MVNRYLEELQQAVKLPYSAKTRRLIRHPVKEIYYQFTRWSGLTQKVVADLFFGERMLVVLPEGVSSWLYRYRFFEEGLTTMVCEYLQEGMTFVDVGAHFGYYTLLGSSIVGSAGHVYSFEPSGGTFKILEENTALKRNITLNRKAVFSKNGLLKFNDYGLVMSAFNSFTRGRFSGEVLGKIRSEEVDVEAVSLDGYFSDSGVHPNFIKIDAESAEYEILVGMQRIIELYRPIISVEVGDMNIPGIKSSKECIMFLIERGYKPFEYKEHGITEHQLRDKYNYDNNLFIP